METSGLFQVRGWSGDLKRPRQVLEYCRGRAAERENLDIRGSPLSVQLSDDQCIHMRRVEAGERTIQQIKENNPWSSQGVRDSTCS